MKKTISLFTILVSAFFVLTSCGARSTVFKATTGSLIQSYTFNGDGTYESSNVGSIDGRKVDYIAASGIYEGNAKKDGTLTITTQKVANTSAIPANFSGTVTNSQAPFINVSENPFTIEISDGKFTLNGTEFTKQ